MFINNTVYLNYDYSKFIFITPKFTGSQITDNYTSMKLRVFS